MKQSKQTWGRQEVAQAEAILAAVTEAISSIESSERAAVIFRIFP
jgi:formaldehyde-activating enzyme involved in methanogenesis